mmetsp:Transcript_26306/g.47141  ORF Transcript_26306/g.47141 Transcript_26306/m.47141 type:complete len:538 (-) Transcript_26306:416-2029(-)
MRSGTPQPRNDKGGAGLQEGRSFESVLSKKIDYKDITAKVKTRRHEVVKSEKIYNLEFYKRTKLMKLKNKHTLMRAITKTEDVSASSKDNRLSENRFERMNFYFKSIRDGKNSPSGLEDLLKEIRKRRKQEDKFDFKQPTEGEANSQILAMDREAWMKKHGINAERMSSIKFTKFIRELFDAFDEDGSMTLELHEIVMPLLALGVAPDATYIEGALKILLNVSDIQNVQIQREQFVSLFQADRKCDFILEVLNGHCDEMMFEEMERKQALKLARSRSSKFSNRMSVRQQMTNFLTVPIELKYNSMFDITRMIRGWWQSLDPEFKSLIKVGEVAEFLVNKKFVSKKHEGKRLITSFATLIDGKYVTNDHFNRIFVKSIFKGALFNIAYGLSHGEFLDANLSLKVKISEYQRRLIVSGLKIWDGKLHKEGTQAVNAISQYKRELFKRLNTAPDKPKSPVNVGSSFIQVDMMKQYYDLNSLPVEVSGRTPKSPAKAKEPEKIAVRTTERFSLKLLAQQQRQRREGELLGKYQDMVNFVVR